MSDDWRITVELGDEHGLQTALDEHELEDDAHDALGKRVAVSADDDNHVFIYADTRETAEHALTEVKALVASHRAEATYALDRWHPVAEEWKPADEPLPETDAQLAEERADLDEQEDEESESSGAAEWEVRLDLPSHHEAVALAEKLSAEGIPVTRRWTYLLVGAEDQDQANALADRLRAEAPAGTTFQVEASGEMVYELEPKRSKLFYFIPNM
jgi:hypothetical protein